MPIANLDTVIGQLRRVAVAVERGAAEALHDEGELVMQVSQRLVPRLTGELAASAFVDPPEIAGGRASVTIGYTAEHAVYTHENLQARHDDGQAKFLSAAVDATERGRSERIGKAITAAIKKGDSMNAVEQLRALRDQLDQAIALLAPLEALLEGVAACVVDRPVVDRAVAVHTPAERAPVGDTACARPGCEQTFRARGLKRYCSLTCQRAANAAVQAGRRPRKAAPADVGHERPPERPAPDDPLPDLRDDPLPDLRDDSLPDLRERPLRAPPPDSGHSDPAALRPPPLAYEQQAEAR